MFKGATRHIKHSLRRSRQIACDLSVSMRAEISEVTALVNCCKPVIVILIAENQTIVYFHAWQACYLD